MLPLFLSSVDMNTEKLVAIYASAGREFPSFEEWLESNGGVEGWLKYCDVHLEDYHHLSEEYPDEYAQEKAIVQLWYEQLWETYRQNIDRFQSMKFPATLYRCVTLHKDIEQIEDIQNIGIYWTDEYEAAECHWGNFGAGQVKYTLEAKVSESAVDWELTLDANMHPHREEEKEIRLLEDKKIELIGYQPEGGGWEEISMKVKA